MKRTEQQLEAITATDDYICVDAGAGSGKTSVLVERIVRLLANGTDLDAIVAITFTDKSAAEMKQRLRMECRARAPIDDPAEMSRWRDLERRVDCARISTIHSFCMSVLKENALRLGIDPDFTVLADADSHLLRAQVVSDVVFESLEEGDGPAMPLVAEFGLTSVQKTLHTLLNKRLTVDCFIHSAAWQSAETLAADWLEKVEAEKRRITQRFKSPGCLPDLLNRAKSYGGHCSNPGERVEEFRRLAVATIERFLQIDSPDDLAADFSTLVSFDFRKGKPKEWLSDEAYQHVKLMREEVRRFAAALYPEKPSGTTEAAAVAVTCRTAQLYKEVAKRLAARKRAMANYDFDDLIGETFKVLRDHLDLRERTARGIQYLLIDEFQDTDPLQLEIASLLRETEYPPHLFIVGDAKQSIYYFRGADAGVFRNARSDARRVVPLDENFRSVPEVLEYVNHFFECSDALSEVESEYHALRPSRASCPGAMVEFLYSQPVDAGGIREDRRAEASLIAWRIRELFESDQSYGKAAILLRALSDVHLYEQALREADIPYSLVSGRGYFERQEVLDIRNLLTVVIDPWNEYALLALLRSPIIAMSDDEILALRLSCATKAGFARVFHGFNDANAPYWDRIARAKSLLADIDAQRGRSLPEFVRYVFERTQYEAILFSQYLGHIKAGNVRKLLDLAAAFAGGQETTLPAFVRYLDEVAAEDIQEGDAALHADGANAVTITTVHKAKGLEFDTVFVADLSRSSTGGRRGGIHIHRQIGMAMPAIDETGATVKPLIAHYIAQRTLDEESAESARVLYVAMTRARERLILCGSPKAPSKKEPDRDKTWMQTFVRLYGLDAIEHGGEGTTDNGVTYRVWRTPPDRHVRRAATSSSVGLSLVGDLQRRIAPIIPLGDRRATYSVSNVLDELFPHSFEGGAVVRNTDPLVRGAITHRLFELWDVADDPKTAIEYLLTYECPRLDMREDIEHSLWRSVELARNSRVLDTNFSGRTPRRELPFTLRIADTIVQGVIDAVSNGAIVDYKTGRRSEKQEARYRWQVQFYAAALARLTNAVPSKGWLYYIDSGEAIEVPLTPDALERTLKETAAALQSIRNKELRETDADAIDRT
jgi:ATP-dependent helicase/nuclease subunit A